MGRTRSLVMAAVVLGAALVPGAVAGAAQPDKADKAKAEHERIVAYWTPERMKAAKPRDFEKQPDGSYRQVATPKGKPSGGSKGKPGGDGGGGGGTTTDPLVPITSGSSWTAGGQALARTGKVYFTMGRSGYVCSGAVADDGNTGGATSIVLTAAHCVNDQTKADGSGWAQNWIFIPDFDTKSNLSTSDCTSADTVYGCWTAQALVAHEGFTRAGGFTTQATQHDFAFAVVGAGGHGGAQLDAVVGGYPLSFDLQPSARLSAFGYPAAGKYSGNDLTYCSGSLITDPYNQVAGADDPWGLACKMTGGSSGGPWLVTETKGDSNDGTLNAVGDGGTLASLNSYGYSGVRYMFGPVLNSKAQALYAVAKAGPVDDTDVP